MELNSELIRRSSSFIKGFFFANYFYGICAVTLSIEAALQQSFSLNEPLYYIFIFFSTVLFYTKAYINEHGVSEQNPRSNWYFHHRKRIKFSQISISLLLLIISIRWLFIYWDAFLNIQFKEILLFISFPITGLLYYGIGNKQHDISLRKIGWLKPFCIGFVWAGLVTIYPILFYQITKSDSYTFTLIGVLLFIKNLMFVTMLCILFDIKDYAMDSNKQIKTLVVETGLRKTIFSFVIPLTIIGLGLFLAYGMTHQFSYVKILLNTIPFLLLILVSRSMHKPKSILYYLILIDGLMLVKACCGIIAMKYF
jgi:hypothetical protein